MKDYFDTTENLIFREFLHLGMKNRAILDGTGVCQNDYTYDFWEEGDQWLAHVHRKNGFFRKKYFTRRIAAKIWLTNFYKDHNE